MSRKITLLGTGSSGGVPRVGNIWGACDPSNPKNRRRRCAILVEQFAGRGRTRVLVDTPADLRDQLLDAEIDSIDAVLYTHDHADHTHGIDDLRGIAFNARRRIDVHADQRTRDALLHRFDYCFVQPPGSSYPAILNAHTITPPAAVHVNGAGGVIEIVPMPQLHGDLPSLGFRFGGVAYSPDVSAIPEASLPLFANLDVWIVDALRPLPHPSHFSVKQALSWIERLRVKRAILTHMTSELDYESLRRELPAHVEPGFDGMVLHAP
jgi:phosphoribosyl 1,2-cyclic phosphate phosphodiesterase